MTRGPAVLRRPLGPPCLIAAAVLFPLVPWLLAGPVEPRVSGNAALKSVANLAAFFAVAAWAANLVLASRVHAVARAAGGLEQLYVLHKRLGVAVLALAAIHAVFLALHAGGGALDLYLPSAGWSSFSGVIALALLAGSVAASLAKRLGYRTFLRLHALLGPAFALGAFHAIAVRGTAAGSVVLTAYLVLLTAAGAASLAYRLLNVRFGVGRRRYRVADVRHLRDDVIEISMTPLAGPLEHEAGQFLYVAFRQNGLPRESHPFTIASAPGGELRIVVKRLGDFTERLMTLRPGARADIEGPFGTFRTSGDGTITQTWIAGGIGITPFLSWARSLDGSLPIDLYYCTPAAEYAHFIDELLAIADRHPRFRVVAVRKSSLGHLTVTDFEAVNPRVCRGDVYICGPQPMIDSLRDGFAARAVPLDRIHSENFDFR